ncbi:MAG: chromate efflux transporter [Limisphaerales bacterium]
MNPTLQQKLANLFDVASLFLRLGATAFGGPAAHIALMEKEVVVERGWLSRPEFLDLLGMVNLIPGPNSTEMAILIGHRRAGWPGLLLGGLCFILPATLIVTVIAWAYVHFGKLPLAEGLLYGIKPVIIAVVVQAMWNLGRIAVKTWLLGMVGVGTVVLAYRGINPLLVLLIAGAFMLVARAAAQPRGTAASLTPLFGATSGFRLLSTAGTLAPFSLWPMFLFFLKVGAVMFGSGYVLLAFLRTDLVEHRHWLTEGQLLDAVAVGQFTPGPLFTTATFIGYILGGPLAALLATVAIFLPAFGLCAVIGPFASRLRQSRLVGGFLDGVNVASLALMIVVTWQLGGAGLVDWLTISLAVAATVWLLCFRVNSTWLILGGAAVGLARYVFQAGT